MSNIQKNFKQKTKRGLCMAVGGILDPYEGMSPGDVAQYTNDPDALNKASTLKWAADERQRQASHPGQAFLNPVAAQEPIAPVASGMTQPAQTEQAAPITPQPAQTEQAAPITTFEQDMQARDTRIRGLRDRLAQPRRMFADGGIVGSDGLTDAQRAKLSGARASLGVSNAAPAPTPAPAATPAPVRAAPVQQPSVGGAINSIRERQRQLSNLADGGVIHNAAEYWADDNARFEKTNPGFVDRIARSVNPMTGFGSAMGAMHTAASSGDVPGMVMAGATAIPAFGVLRTAPAVGAAKATVAPSLRKSMVALVGGATANAASDEYQSKNNSGLATGGVVGAKTFEFEGKGTGTSDDIPVKVAGNHVNVSKGEKAVILPAKTAQNPQALDMIEDVIEQTNGKPPNRGLRDGFNFTKGGFVDDYGNLNPPNRFQNAANNEVLRQQVNNAAPGAQLRPDQTAAMAEKAAANRPAPVTQKPAGPGVMNIAGRAIGAGTHAYGAAASDIPAEQVSHAIKGAAYTAGPWWGTGVDVADALVNKATDGKYNMATGLDAAAKWASDNVPGMRGDYMLPPEFQPGGTGKAAPAPAAAPTAEEQAANRAALIPPAPGTTTPATFVPEGVASNTPKLDAEVTRRGLSGLKTIGTVNGDVTAGRDKNGQLHVMAGVDNTDAQNEALRAKEADRMTKDLARQVQVFDGLRAERLQASPDPAERAMGLAQAQQQILQQQNRTTAAHNEATMADAKEGRSIQRAAQAQQADQFNKTLAANEAIRRAAAEEAANKHASEIIKQTNYDKDKQNAFEQSVRLNEPAYFKMSHAAQQEHLPYMMSRFEENEERNKVSTSGGSSNSARWRNVKGTDTLNTTDDVASDPSGVVSSRKWFGDPRDPRNMGIANIWARNILPDALVGGNRVDVLDDDTRVMQRDDKGDRGPLKAGDRSIQKQKQIEYEKAKAKILAAAG